MTALALSRNSHRCHINASHHALHHVLHPTPGWRRRLRAPAVQHTGDGQRRPTLYLGVSGLRGSLECSGFGVSACLSFAQLFVTEVVFSHLFPFHLCRLRSKIRPPTLQKLWGGGHKLFPEEFCLFQTPKRFFQTCAEKVCFLHTTHFPVMSFFLSPKRPVFLPHLQTLAFYAFYAHVLRGFGNKSVLFC